MNICKIDELSEKFKGMYAIVDSAIYPEIFDLFDLHNPKNEFLFKDDWLYEYIFVAPYLVDLQEKNFRELLIENGRGSDWLTLLWSQKDLEDVAVGLREYIVVYSKAHNMEIIHRFYDPRNLDGYFQRMDEHQKERFFFQVCEAIGYIDGGNENRLILYDLGKKMEFKLGGIA